MRPALARGVAAAAVILAVVVALMTLSYVRVDSTTPFARRYGLRQAPLRRSRGGALRTRLRVGAGPDAFGVVSRRYERSTPGPTLVVAPGDAVTVELVNGLGAEDGAARARDSLRRPNTTSLHMHGWHQGSKRERNSQLQRLTSRPFSTRSADFWTSDHLSERSRSVDAFSGTRARGTLTLKRR